MKNRETGTMYNLDYLYKISEGDMEFIDEMTRLFIIEIPVKLNKIIALLSEGRREMATDEIHRIAPNFSLFGLHNIIAKMNKIECSLRSGAEETGVISELECIRYEFNKVAVKLKSDCNIYNL